MPPKAKTTARTLIPVILCGGTGSRLWPLSRQDYPKQLLALTGAETLLQQTARRFMGNDTFSVPMVISNDSYRFAVAEQLRQLDIAARLVLEPSPKNTAPAVAVAALIAAETDPDAVLIVAAADHYVKDTKGFLSHLDAAIAAAEAGYIVSLGIKPSAPETGFGYIEQGKPLTPGSLSIKQFVEKPDSDTAKKYLKSGNFFWNAGIFVFKAKTLLEELEKFQPAMLKAAAKAVKGRSTDLDFIRLEAASWNSITADSLDYAVMEKTSRAAVVPTGDIGWSDVGSWSALWDIDADKDKDGNTRHGTLYTHNARNNYLRAHDKQLLAVVGVENLVVVATADAVLVAHQDHAQDVKKIVEKLQKDKRTEAVHNRLVYRPWGSYESIDDGERFQVKRLVVKPGQKLSLQKHFHRAEHWVVVAGTAVVRRDGEEHLLRENESIYLPLGCTHRLENPGKIELMLVEVQSGSYLGEDDIVRFEDTYGRVPSAKITKN